MPAVHAARPSPRLAIGALVSALIAIGAPLRAQPGGEQHTVRGPDIAIYNLVGSLRAEPGNGSDVVVQVTRAGKDAGELQVRTGVIDGRQTLRVVYPDDDIYYADMGRGSRTSLRVRDDGTFGGRDGGRRVTISGDRDGVDARADLVVRVPKGQRIALYLGAGEVLVNGVDGEVTVDASSAPVTVQRTRGRLHLDTGSGEVSIADAEGEMSLDTGSGEVRLTNVRGPQLRVDAGSGALTGDNIDVARLSLDVGSGSTRLRDVRSDEIDLDSGSGDVDLAFARDVRSLDVDSGSGSVTLRVPESLGARLEIETGSGGVETDIPLTITRRTESMLVGTLGDGDGRIRIEAGSGEVRIRRS